MQHSQPSKLQIIGSTFGLYHLGVVKTLLENNCLPRIVCGSSIGSLIAALVCIHTDDELPAVFLPGGIDLKAFAKKSNKGNLQRKLTRLLKHGKMEREGGGTKG